MTADDQDLHTLAGAYALDALSALERSAFGEHLAACAQCRQEIQELREATARLGTSVAVRPRPELRAPTIQAARRISQLAPVVPATIEPAHSPPAELPAPARRSRAGSRPGWAAGRALPRIAAAAIVVVSASAVALGIGMQDTMRQLHHSQQQEHLIISVMTASDAVTRTGRVSSGGTARIVMSRREHMGVFTARRLAPLPATKCYELWLMGPAGDRPAGMLTAKGAGMSGPAIISGMAAGDIIALTIEPVSGSSQPTSAPLVFFAANSPGK